MRYRRVRAPAGQPPRGSGAARLSGRISGAQGGAEAPAGRPAGDPLFAAPRDPDNPYARYYTRPRSFSELCPRAAGPKKD